MSDKIVLNTSEEAAKFVENISGWVSRNGLFFGNNKKSEEIARYEGCTHFACKYCGEPTEKRYTACSVCREKIQEERFAKREKAVWDGKGMLYCDVVDRYFSSWDEIYEYLDNEDLGGLELNNMRLVICEPIFLSPITEDHWYNDLPEDGELPENIVSLIEKLNLELKSHGPVSFTPGKVAVIVPEKQQNTGNIKR